MSEALLKISLIGIFIAGFTGFYLLLPIAQPLPAGVTQAVQFFIGSLWKFNFILPIDILFSLFLAIMVIEGIFYIVDFFKWISGVLSNLF